MKVEDAGKMLNGDLNKIKLDKAADYIGTYYMWNGILMPEYDMREPHAISDTEVYVKQAVARKLALAARAGYEIMSDREEDADYIQTRINAFEFVTERSFESFIKGILRNLFLCSNCFLLKIRKEALPRGARRGGRQSPSRCLCDRPRPHDAPLSGEGEDQQVAPHLRPWHSVDRLPG